MPTWPLHQKPRIYYTFTGVAAMWLYWLGRTRSCFVWRFPVGSWSWHKRNQNMYSLDLIQWRVDEARPLWENNIYISLKAESLSFDWWYKLNFQLLLKKWVFPSISISLDKIRFQKSSQKTRPKPNFSTKGSIQTCMYIIWHN